MNKKIAVVFFSGREQVKSINFYGFQETEVRFIVDQRIVAADVNWASYEIV